MEAPAGCQLYSQPGFHGTCYIAVCKGCVTFHSGRELDPVDAIEQWKKHARRGHDIIKRHPR